MSRTPELIGILLVIGLVILSLRAWPGAQSGVDPTRYFTPEEIARGADYTRGRYLLFGLRTGLELTFLLVLVFSPIAASLWEISLRGAGARFYPALVTYGTIIYAAGHLLLFPLRFYAGFLRERTFGLSTQTLGGWLADYGKGMLVEWTILLPCLVILYLLLRTLPAGWFIPAGFLGGSLLVLLVALSPIVIDPLFHTFTPLRDPALRSRVLHLAGRAGIRVEEVYVSDASSKTRKENAYVTGLGGTRRIVLFDTLVSRSSPAEVEAVLAHEIGHWMSNHLWKGIGLSTLLLFVLLAIAAAGLRWASARGVISAPGDPVGLPLVILLLFALQLITLPLRNGVSRSFEHEADRVAVALTGEAAAAVRLDVKLARSNLADVVPPVWAVWLLYTHPPVLERIALAEQAREGSSSP